MRVGCLLFLSVGGGGGEGSIAVFLFRVVSSVAVALLLLLLGNLPVASVRFSPMYIHIIFIRWSRFSFEHGVDFFFVVFAIKKKGLYRFCLFFLIHELSGRFLLYEYGDTNIYIYIFTTVSS